MQHAWSQETNWVWPQLLSQVRLFRFDGFDKCGGVMDKPALTWVIQKVG